MSSQETTGDWDFATSKDANLSMLDGISGTMPAEEGILTGRGSRRNKEGDRQEGVKKGTGSV